MLFSSLSAISLYFQHSMQMFSVSFQGFTSQFLQIFKTRFPSSSLPSCYIGVSGSLLQFYLKYKNWEPIQKNALCCPQLVSHYLFQTLSRPGLFEQLLQKMIIWLLIDCWAGGRTTVILNRCKV